MNSKKMHSGIKLDVRIILSASWAARVLCGLQGDSTRFHDPLVLKDLVAGTTEIPVTNLMLLVLSIVLSLPIIMSFLSLIMKEKVNRRVNLGVGIFFVMFELIFLIFVYSQEPAYEMFWGGLYLVFAGLVVRYAWKWPKQEA